MAFNVIGRGLVAQTKQRLLIKLIMVSTRASARLKKEAADEAVEANMKDKTEMEEEKAPATNDCSECKENIADNGVKKNDASQEEEVGEEKAEEGAHPINGYLKGFVKRVVACTILVMAAKNSWPYFQSRFWPEEPVKVSKFRTGGKMLEGRKQFPFKTVSFPFI